MKKKSRIGLNIGTSSILLVFVLLCMVTFAALSFVSANADYKLSQSLKTRTTAYYTAANTAERQLSEIEAVLSGIKDQCSDMETYQSMVAENLAALYENTDAPPQKDSCGTLRWQEPFTDTQSLEVILTLTNPYRQKDYFTVSQWKVVSTAPWEDSQTIHLFDGQ